MKTYIQISIISLLFLIMFVKANGQDFHLSMTEEAPVLLNPSLSGMFDGLYRGHLQHRTQWKSVVAKPFRTEMFSVERNFKEFGVGLHVLNNRAGAGDFNVFNLYGSGSYEVSLDPGKYHHLLCGLQIGLVQNSINIANLTFDNQYTMSGGGGYDPALSSGENFTKTSALAPDVNFGIYYTMQKRRNFFSSYVYKTSTLVPYGGISGYHLTQPKLTYSDYRNKLFMRLLFYGGVKYKVTSDFCVDPSIIWQRQSKMNDVMWGSNFYYYIQSYKTFASLGLFHRVKDAVVISIGGVRNQYTIRFSYDINTSKLNAVSKGRGGFEISITYTMLDEGSYPMF